jgi:hypothetical protein
MGGPMSSSPHAWGNDVSVDHRTERCHRCRDSYIRYLNDHNIFVPGINDAVRISRGSQVCTSLHNGMTPQQIIDANPIVYFDLRGVIDAAQHELCPDTLH